MTITTANRAHTLSDRFASRTGVFNESIWTSIFQQFRKHSDPVYFGDGSPAPEVIPVARLREASVAAWADAPDSLKYGDQQGYAPLRELVSSRISQRGIEATADEILIAGGSTQALDIACRVFLEPGDAVIVESPTFLGALEIFSLFEVEVIPVTMDADGMRMDELESILLSHGNAKIIYTIPTFHNPTGITMSLERRQQLVALANEHNVAIFEDDPYGELQYSGEPIPPIRSLDEQVIHFGTFSKTIAPGVRTGFAIAPPEVMEKMLGIREVSDISNDRIMMRTLYHASLDFLNDHVAEARTLYRARRDVMLESLENEMPTGVTWSQPDGGFFVWVTVPESIDARDLFDRAAENGVIVFPGEWFYTNRDVHRNVRLSFSTVPEDRIRIGIERLGTTLREMLD